MAYPVNDRKVADVRAISSMYKACANAVGPRPRPTTASQLSHPAFTSPGLTINASGHDTIAATDTKAVAKGMALISGAPRAIRLDVA